MVAWTEKTDYQLVKVDFYDRKNDIKNADADSYRLYLKDIGERMISYGKSCQ